MVSIQRSTFSTVAQLIDDCSRIGAGSPAVIVIGDVVSAAAAMAAENTESTWWDA